jgi:hypothetical protein
MARSLSTGVLITVKSRASRSVMVKIMIPMTDRDNNKVTNTKDRIRWPVERAIKTGAHIEMPSHLIPVVPFVALDEVLNAGRHIAQLQIAAPSQFLGMRWSATLTASRGYRLK